ncbi:hypothetical protein ACFLXC_00120 [Chloroflexota bacterium]
MPSFSDTGLTEFPFKDVPPAEPTDLWVGRPKFLSDITQLVSSWAYNKNSSIYFIWADFGAGKTHSLRYIEYLANIIQSSYSAVYCELPKGITQFKFIYEQIMPRFSEEILCSAIQGYRQRYGDNWLSAQILNGDRDTPRVMWTLAQTINQPQGEISRKWLRGERLSSAELRVIDNVTPIKTSEQATRTLSTLCRIVLQDSKYSRIVIMVDEFQRIARANKNQIKEINDGIHTLFNSCPKGLSIILTYSIGVPDSIKYLTTDAVRSRLKQVLTLPIMSKVELKDFIVDLLKKYQIPDTTVKVFTQDAIEWVINKLFEDSVKWAKNEVAEDASRSVTPRIAMQEFSKILEKTINGDGPYQFPIDKGWVKSLYVDPTSWLFSTI